MAQILKKISILIFFNSLIFLSCKQPQPENTIIFDAKKNKFVEYFQKVKQYKIPRKITNKINLLGISKLVELSSGNWLVSDNASNQLLLLDENGQLIKVIGSEGGGPGEFGWLSDFIYANQKIFALDFIRQRTLIFSNFKYETQFPLSYVHRNPELISKTTNGFFVISAERNLKDGSTPNDYGFLEFEDNQYLNVYDSLFNLQHSFLSPDDKIKDTFGVFARAKETTFTPFCVFDDKIIATTQEGFYNIFIYQSDGKLEKKYSVKENSFVKFDLNDAEGLKLINGSANFDLEKIGKIIASYSSPISIHKINSYLIFTILDPYDNYFPMYSRLENLDNNYHFDIYKFNDNKLIPIKGGIRTNKRIIGVAKNGDIFLSGNQHKEILDSIIVERYMLKL